MTWSNPLSSLATLVRDRIERWEAHGEPSAAQVLAEHPELREARSLVMDLVLAEYSLRKESGDAIEKAEFCEQFPEYRQSLEYLLEVQDYLDRCPEFATPDETVEWPIPGELFLGYEILEPLGRGGLARVFLAREKAVGNRHVVIKVSPLGDHEAQTLGKLAHSAIVPIHSVKHDEEGDWTVICMPLLGAATGIDLLDAAFHQPAAGRDAGLVARVARETRPLSPVGPASQETRDFPWHYSYADAICRIGLDIAEALAQAHASGVLHRDIKPSNILLSWSGQAMLLDFNLSTRDDLAPQRIGGTLAYMAPEVIESLLNDQGRAARRFDPRCDVYSLGVVLYELLTGRLPFKPADAERLALNAYEPWLDCKRVPELPLASGAWGVETGLAAIVQKCIAFDPAERFSDAASLAQALREYLSGGAVVQRIAKRKRRELVLALLALAASMIGIFSYVGSQPSRLDALYQRALAEYEAGEFKKAERSFSDCLALRSNWPQALFGRGQSLRQQGQWKAARADFLALAEVEPRWAYALAGYCSMRGNDDQSASYDFRRAYEKGLRDFEFLMNYAAVNKLRGRYEDAVRLYSDVLAIDPLHKLALSERAQTHVALVINDGRKIPDGQAFDDVHQYREIEKTFEGPYLAARIYGEAARKDVCYEDAAHIYLVEAIEKGLPKSVLGKLPLELRWLISKLDSRVVALASDHPEAARSKRDPLRHPPQTADWTSFLQRPGENTKLLAGSE
jgi:serine/threonine protein kinase